MDEDNCFSLLIIPKINPLRGVLGITSGCGKEDPFSINHCEAYTNEKYNK